LRGNRFTLGIGTGEALNEHILGRRWPPAEERLEMLEEAWQVIKDLLSGKLISHTGPHYTGVGAYTDAGFDDVYIGQVGGESEGFFEFYAGHVLPRLREAG
jgi:alkanesulfonate monooxygenase SsuD/methylene tetrahydromethanopterin reductase-like flavin-dependent oxidoreductase (luciferase family)